VKRASTIRTRFAGDFEFFYALTANRARPHSLGLGLDNNICERALKKAILHRKNALFFKTRHGAAVGDLYLSLIHTCELNSGNPFEYLAALQRNAADVAADPGSWMPWNYRERLACVAAG
jgi:transposase